ncbi:MAG: exopolysaccharide biosynthesis polyprenyl glycosylphosphotransferase [Acidocella sp.]|nr:exopolysaccharide biosynthesis polyprenyl glycosylphosphotransferase [Acidocella sp.]
MDGGAIFRVAINGLPSDNCLQDTTLASDLERREPIFTSKPYDFKAEPLLSWVVKATDVLVVSLAAISTISFDDRLFRLHPSPGIILSHLIAVLLYFLTVKTARPVIHRIRDSIFSQILSFSGSLVIATFGLGVALLWLGVSGLAVTQICGTWFSFVFAGLTASRVCFGFGFRHPLIKQRLCRRFAIVGSGAYAELVVDTFKSTSDETVDFVGLFSADFSATDDAQSMASMSDLFALASHNRLDAIIIALPPCIEYSSQVGRLCLQLRGIPADILAVPHSTDNSILNAPIRTIGPMPFTVLQLRPLNERQRMCKRMFDIFMSVIGLIIVLPLFLMVFLAIKLDSPGPIFFRQPRRGFNNRQFLVFKFRSMCSEQADLHSLRQTSRDDPRVTRVGKWLRRLSIDELPQLLNVLRGDMSMVGPRPHALQTRVQGELLDDVIEDYGLRYQVKPGITGLAQISGARGELVTREDIKRRVEYDLTYIKNWSFWSDLKIIFFTIKREIFSRHAF